MVPSESWYFFRACELSHNEVRGEEVGREEDRPGSAQQTDRRSYLPSVGSEKSLESDEVEHSADQRLNKARC